jgi:hypothetical protein
MGTTSIQRAFQDDTDGDDLRPDVELAHAEGRVCRVECRTCGYEPSDQHEVPTHRCPKCHASTWVRFVRSDVIRIVGPRWDSSRLAVRQRPVFRCALPSR